MTIKQKNLYLCKWFIGWKRNERKEKTVHNLKMTEKRTTTTTGNKPMWINVYACEKMRAESTMTIRTVCGLVLYLFMCVVVAVCSFLLSVKYLHLQN